MRIAIFALLGLLAGCTTTSTSTAPSVPTGPSAGLNRAYNACQTAYETSARPTRTSRAQCLNNAENRFASEFPDRAALSQQQGLRLALAKRVDSGQMTQAAADAAYARELTKIQAASEARRAAG
ncbi:hypothetical protein OSH10_06675 [Kaistia defluvii]|uniref:hypothetical protein n=1 Tax=Kaistia defluvii TaxID=410841 RepID=UPI002256A1AC|nr:hypothetical protein [Kaistia defluvii]MCX5518112.1 hypothetical protein [Kaistia defluvii]